MTGAGHVAPPRRAEAERSPLAPIARLIESSAVDGPGNRAAVFLQGCDFDCAYCHNPETIALASDRAARPASGGAEGEPAAGWRFMSAREVADFVERQKPFVSGVTVSGGECTLHPAFLESLFSSLCGESFTTLADSNGSIPFASLPGVVASLDGVLLDVKAWDREEHFRLTGADNANTLANLGWLAERGLLTEARTVVSPGLFDLEGTIANVARVLSRAKPGPFGPPVYRITAFRPQGVRERWRSLAQPDGACMARLAKLALDEGAPRVLFA